MKKYLLLLALPLVLTACEIEEGSAREGMRRVESQQQSLVDKVPPPILSDSLERRNIVARLERVNKANLNGYIYLISFGKIMAYYPVKGKVSSLNSYLTPQEQITSVRTPSGFANWSGPLDAPDLDGSYGFNDNGIFFFTTTDAYVEWKGEYLWSDQSLSLQESPTLIQHITQ